MNNKQEDINLKKAITRLPSYEPPASSWENIQQGIALQEGVQQLPTYTPPETIWDNIETNLPVTSPKVKVAWSIKWAVAAAILLLFGTTWWINSLPTKSAEFRYSMEVIDAQLLQEDWDDDTVLAEIEAICEVKRFTCLDEQFQHLEQELTELNEAKSQLKIAIADYGKDTELIAQLSAVELERTTVLKKMIATVF